MKIGGNYEFPNHAKSKGNIIKSFCSIEQTIDIIILLYFDIPAKHEEKFLSLMLNSSIITVGAKIKVLTNLELLDKKTTSQLRIMNSIRNAFAHVNATKHLDLINKKGESRMYIMNSEGLIKPKVEKELIEEYFDLYKKVHVYLEHYYNETMDRDGPNL